MTKDYFRTTRSVNPLHPTYKVRNEEGKLVEIGEIERNHPKKLPYRKDPFNGAYDVRDIFGAAPGSKLLGPFHSITRKDFLDPNNIQDIDGAKPDTIKKGI